ncbi:MAG: hypothetical protein H6668_10840 [Ardenticatenaceae bacterium]|nr:hypothetical protein [Ardenticatenaceae bacterium]
MMKILVNSCGWLNLYGWPLDEGETAVYNGVKVASGRWQVASLVSNL